MSGGPSVIRRPTFEKSNTELTSSLRANITAHQSSPPTPTLDGTARPKPSFKTWTTQHGAELYIPTHTPSPLSEPRDSYDITVKLFYLPNIPASRRCLQTREAIDLVLRELGASSIDLLIVSFPGISFDADDEDSDLDDDEFDEGQDGASAPTSSAGSGTNGVTAVDQGCADAETPPEDMETMIATWRTLEGLHREGLVGRLGISEFGCARLGKFLPRTQVKPSVDQINVRDCCVVPKPLILYAKQQGVELLTHNDCTNVLPRGTLREILGTGEKGMGVLAGEGNAEGLKGDVEPQWVVKYTAVVKDRGVVESKGYFAVAELREGL
ncbi:glutamate-cysteine ligase-like protein regulatory subunit [Corynespora cassiicola Philippines]|uniref:GCS light chain n=1 Tax=Corynespora cassiicola Philippines TaxID=1448308 RepID=A0A2T2NM55_CORCC|nr:glutamate-cysteine ligase-like protein regulatory subunit [Corynespora cassiicola Philippines]